MKVLMDQFARCFNAAGDIREEDGDNRQSSSSSSHSKQAQSAQPMESSDRKSSDNLSSLWPGRYKTSCHLKHCTSAMSESDREQAQVLAQTRQQATASTQRHKSTISLESLSKETKMEKARHKSNKRKLDIFRNVDKPPPTRNSFSKFLSNHKSSAGSMLCFANPIFDSQDDDPRHNHKGDNSTVNDEETITSTLYFDAKYAHLVEQQTPVALYREWSLEEQDSKDDIVKIFEAGFQKSIKVVDVHPEMNPSATQNEGAALMPFPRSRSSRVSNNSANASATNSVISGLDMSPSEQDAQGIETESPPTVHLSIPSPPEFTPRNLVTIEEMFEESKNPPAINLTSKTSIGTARTVSSSNSHSSSPRLRLKRREEVLNVSRISELESCYHDD